MLGPRGFCRIHLANRSNTEVSDQEREGPWRGVRAGWGRQEGQGV